MKSCIIRQDRRVLGCEIRDNCSPVAEYNGHFQEADVRQTQKVIASLFLTLIPQIKLYCLQTCEVDSSAAPIYLCTDSVTHAVVRVCIVLTVYSSQPVHVDRGEP